MRIITGQYKGRHFDIPRSFKARPTTDFAKENIFNVLQNYIGRRQGSSDSRRCIPLLENLQAEVRFHLCRSAIRAGEASRDSRPRTQWRPSQRRGHLRFRTWQELRFLRPSPIPGTQKLRKRKLLDIQIKSGDCFKAFALTGRKGKRKTTQGDALG